MNRLAGWWRHAALAGLVIGLLASPHLAAPPGWAACSLVAAIALAALGRDLLGSQEQSRGLALPGWLACLCAVGVLAGLGIGSARMSAIDGGAFNGPVGAEVTLSGFVDAVPRRSFGEVRVPIATSDGRILLVAREPVGPLPVGSGIEARGRLAAPDPFHRSELERLGSSLELQADRLKLTGLGRDGLAGALDRIRTRAETGLGEGMNDAQSALARGFVLGEDDLIDSATRDDFKRSGLAHLLSCYEEDKTFLGVFEGITLGPITREGMALAAGPTPSTVARGEG